LLGTGASTSLAADAISSPERCSPVTGCSFDAASYFMGVGESPIVAMPPTLDYPHNVVSTNRGADDRAMFESDPFVTAGKSSVVYGTEYLSAGEYRFICSIHKERTIAGTRMEATLVVVDNGLAPRPRPRVELKMTPQTLERALEQRVLNVAVRADQPSDDVKLIVKAGRKMLGTKKGVDAGPGGFERVAMPFGGKARRVLGKRDSALVTVIGAARFGDAEILRRRLN
jgi:plastocyanin